MDGFANVMQSSGTIGDGGEHLSIAWVGTVSDTH